MVVSELWFQDICTIFHILPRSTANLADEIAVMFIGQELPPRDDDWHKRILRVRRWKVMEAVRWLIANNPRYQSCTLDEHALDDIPDTEDGIIPDSVWQSVQNSTTLKVHSAETAGYVRHPKKPFQAPIGSASAPSSPLVGEVKDGKDAKFSDEHEEDYEMPFSSSGVIDMDANGVSSQAVHSAGIRNVLARSDAPDEHAYYEPHDHSHSSSSSSSSSASAASSGSAANAETDRKENIYNMDDSKFPKSASKRDHSLEQFHLPAQPVSERTERYFLELAYPALYPFGVGGYDFTRNGPKRRSALSVENYVKHCLEIRDPRFRHHLSWIYILANLIQRRTVAIRAGVHATTQGFINDADKINVLQSEYVSSKSILFM